MRAWATERARQERVRGGVEMHKSILRGAAAEPLATNSLASSVPDTGRYNRSTALARTDARMTNVVSV